MYTLAIDGRGFPRLPSPRRTLICSLARIARTRGGLVAFGLGRDHLRVVTHCDVQRSVRALLAQRGVRVSDWVPGTLPRIEAASWAHETAPGEPLARVWTSHRDVLGFRHAGWVAPWSAEEAEAVHLRLGGGRLPKARSLYLGEVGGDSDRLLRQTAVLVTGRVRFHPQCRALVAALALDLGAGVDRAAAASGLTPRRVRQIRCAPDPRVAAARATLIDRRLQVSLTPAPEARMHQNGIEARVGGTCSGSESVRSCSWSSWSSL